MFILPEGQTMAQIKVAMDAAEDQLTRTSRKRARAVIANISAKVSHRNMESMNYSVPEPLLIRSGRSLGGRIVS